MYPHTIKWFILCSMGLPPPLHLSNMCPTIPIGTSGPVIWLSEAQFGTEGATYTQSSKEYNVAIYRDTCLCPTVKSTIIILAVPSRDSTVA